MIRIKSSILLICWSTVANPLSNGHIDWVRVFFAVLFMFFMWTDTHTTTVFACCYQCLGSHSVCVVVVVFMWTDTWPAAVFAVLSPISMWTDACTVFTSILQSSMWIDLRSAAVFAVLSPISMWLDLRSAAVFAALSPICMWSDTRQKGAVFMTPFLLEFSNT